MKLLVTFDLSWAASLRPWRVQVRNARGDKILLNGAKMFASHTSAVRFLQRIFPGHAVDVQRGNKKWMVK